MSKRIWKFVFRIAVKFGISLFILIVIVAIVSLISEPRAPDLTDTYNRVAASLAEKEAAKRQTDTVSLP